MEPQCKKTKRKSRLWPILQLVVLLSLTLFPLPSNAPHQQQTDGVAGWLSGCMRLLGGLKGFPLGLIRICFAESFIQLLKPFLRFLSVRNSKSVFVPSNYIVVYQFCSVCNDGIKPFPVIFNNLYCRSKITPFNYGQAISVSFNSPIHPFVRQSWELLGPTIS